MMVRSAWTALVLFKRATTESPDPSAMWGHREGLAYKPSPRHKAAAPLSRASRPEIVRNKFCGLQAAQPAAFRYSSLNGLGQTLRRHRRDLRKWLTKISAAAARGCSAPGPQARGSGLRPWQEHVRNQAWRRIFNERTHTPSPEWHLHFYSHPEGRKPERASFPP